MATNHLDAYALAAPGGFMDGLESLTQSILAARMRQQNQDREDSIRQQTWAREDTNRNQTWSREDANAKRQRALSLALAAAQAGAAPNFTGEMAPLQDEAGAPLSAIASQHKAMNDQTTQKNKTELLRELAQLAGSGVDVPDHPELASVSEAARAKRTADLEHTQAGSAEMNAQAQLHAAKGAVQSWNMIRQGLGIDPKGKQGKGFEWKQGKASDNTDFMYRTNPDGSFTHYDSTTRKSYRVGADGISHEVAETPDASEPKAAPAADDGFHWYNPSTWGGNAKPPGPEMGPTSAELNKKPAVTPVSNATLEAKAKQLGVDVATVKEAIRLKAQKTGQPVLFEGDADPAAAAHFTQSLRGF